MKKTTRPPAHRHWPVGNGEMAKRIRAYDWAATPLGPIETWPQSLKTALDIILAHEIPAAMTVGHEEIVLYNDAYARMIGSHHPSTLGNSVFDAFAEVRPFYESTLGQVRSGKTLTQERQLYPFVRNGTLEDAWFTITYAPLCDESGAIVGVFSVMIEVTAQVLAEQRRDASEAQLQLALDASASGTFYWYPAEDRGEPDERMQALFGLPPDSTLNLGQALSTLIHEDDRAPYGAAVARATDPSGNGELHHDIRVIHPDGSQRWLAINARVFFDGVPPAATRMAGMATDITGRMRVEEALRASERNLSGVANVVPDLLWHSEPDGSTTWYNDRWMEYTGQTFEEAMGWGWTDTIHPNDREASARLYREAIEQNKPLQQEHRIRRHDGEYRWFLVRAAPLRDEQGRVVRMYGAATDIHEQRVEREDLFDQVSVATTQLRALSRQLLLVQEEERRHLARELHDEIGQALTGLQLRLRATTRAGGAGEVETLTEALTEAEALVRELTERVRTISIGLRPATLDTLGLLPALLELVRRFEILTGVIVDLRHQGLNRRFAPEVEIVAYRVAQEALTNVARHAGIRLATVQLLADTRMLTVTIRDKGRGFDVDHTSRTGGLGGMQERAGLLNGSLVIESAPGAGTLVVAEVPIDDYGETGDYGDYRETGDNDGVYRVDQAAPGSYLSERDEGDEGDEGDEEKEQRP